MKIELIIRDLMILISLFELIHSHVGTQVINEVCFGLWGTILIVDLFLRKTDN